MEQITPKEQLQKFVTSRFPDVPAGLFDGAFDDPNFAVDQTYRPLLDTAQPRY
jgi:hypothetical protein